MCRAIKNLRAPGSPSDEELEDAASQFVRKITGLPKTSRRHSDVMSTAVIDIAHTMRVLLGSVGAPTENIRPAPDDGLISGRIRTGSFIRRRFCNISPQDRSLRQTRYDAAAQANTSAPTVSILALAERPSSTG